jgi:transcriptional regulator with GAF, ATPase, and Fis domain
MLLDALEKNNWVQTRAAAFLGISERVLRYKMKKHDLKNVAPTKNSSHNST